MPAPEPHRPVYEGPRDSRAGWILLYVVAVTALVVGAAAVSDGSAFGGWVVGAAIVVPSFLLGLRLRAWALLGPLLFLAGGFALLLPAAGAADSGDEALALGGFLVVIGTAIALAGVVAGIAAGSYAALWRWTGRDD